MPLSQAEITQLNPQQYQISGTVNFSTVTALLQQSSVLLGAVNTSDNQQVTIDLAKIEECNSAALALMLELVKNAGQKNIQLKFENLPATVLTIAKAYGVESEIRELCE